MWTGRVPGGESLVQHHRAKPLKSLGLGKSFWQGGAPQKAVPGPRWQLPQKKPSLAAGSSRRLARDTGCGQSVRGASALPLRFPLCPVWFRPQKWVHPQPSLLHGGRNLERSLGLPAKVTLTGLTQVLCGYFYPMAVPSRLPTWLRFTSAPTHLCGAEVVLLVVPPAAPASALPSTATTGQGLSSPRAAWGLTLVRHGLNCQVSAPVG